MFKRFQFVFKLVKRVVFGFMLKHQRTNCWKCGKFRCIRWDFKGNWRWNCFVVTVRWTLKKSIKFERLNFKINGNDKTPRDNRKEEEITNLLLIPFTEKIHMAKHSHTNFVHVFSTLTPPTLSIRRPWKKWFSTYFSFVLCFVFIFLPEKSILTERNYVNIVHWCIMKR